MHAAPHANHRPQVSERKPPTPHPERESLPVVFVGGSIEMGQAEDWQLELKTALADTEILLLNPRRDHWDASWTQSAENPPFREQVEWELDGLARADMIAFFFAPGTRSPITLLELGLFAASGKVVVCCPDGYWRKGNVDIVCERHGIPQVSTVGELAAYVKRSMRAPPVDI